MKTYSHVLRFVLLDLLRRRVLFAYAVFLFLVTAGMLYFGAAGEKALLAAMNILFLIVPLMCIVFGSTYLYNAREFTVLLLAQPVSRRTVFAGQFTGLSLALCVALVAGAGLPMLLFGAHAASWLLLALCILLTVCFTALALWIALLHDDKARGTGLALILWFYFTLLFDGLILLAVLYFSDYPVEPYIIAGSFLNPVDIARIALMMKLNVSALMGYTGALYVQWFGGAAGTALALTALTAWCILPGWLAARSFRRRDF